jgi:hypothetical protein
MATRSTISVQMEPNKFLSIYCHFDGYPEHHGPILLENYNTYEKVMELMNLGDLSILGPNIGSEHNFKSNDYNVCTAYGRDRNEKDTKAKTYDNSIDLKNQQYAYLFKDGKWWYSDCYGDQSEFKLLTAEDCL